MDWLERLFGLNLDGGDGTAEAAIVLTCIIVGAAAVVRMCVVNERIRVLFKIRQKDS
jgi:hypothetical protein